MISSLELARLCGTSQGTVDRALHNRPGVSARTRERIIRAAEHHHYRPHPAARELLTGRSRMVGTLLPTINNIFYMDLLDDLSRELAARNFYLQLTPVRDRRSFLLALEEFAARRFRAVLVIPPEDNIPVPAAITRGLPIISFVSPCRGPGVQFLSLDEEKTGRTAVDYLHGKGHRRLVHLTSTRRAFAIQARTRGYRQECIKRGLRPLVIKSLAGPGFWRTLEREKPTAIFCHNDWLALQVMLVLSEKGIRVPEDISVLGVDDSPTLISLCPGLTTLAYPRAAAVRAFVKILEHQPADLASERHHLVERTTVRRLLGDGGYY